MFASGAARSRGARINRITESALIIKARNQMRAPGHLSDARASFARRERRRIGAVTYPALVALHAGHVRPALALAAHHVAAPLARSVLVAITTWDTQTRMNKSSPVFISCERSERNARPPAVNRLGPSLEQLRAPLTPSLNLERGLHS